MRNQFLDDMSCGICDDEDSVEDETHVFVDYEELKEKRHAMKMSMLLMCLEIKPIQIPSRKLKMRDLILYFRS